MSWIRKIRDELKELGFRQNLRQEIESLGIELTVCQLIVVVFSIISVAFLFVPFLYLQNPIFMILFFGISLLSLLVGIWFWLHAADICEHPEDYQE